VDDDGAGYYYSGYDEVDLNDYVKPHCDESGGTWTDY
jgi:hypothetical protein